MKTGARIPLITPRHRHQETSGGELIFGDEIAPECNLPAALWSSLGYNLVGKPEPAARRVGPTAGGMLRFGLREPTYWLATYIRK